MSKFSYKPQKFGVQRTLTDTQSFPSTSKYRITGYVLNIPRIFKSVIPKNCNAFNSGAFWKVLAGKSQMSPNFNRITQ